MMTAWLTALPVLLLMGVLGWWYAYQRQNVNIVDSLWSIFFLVAAIVYEWQAGSQGITDLLLLVLVALWSLRLGLYLTMRNEGKAEDRRYAAMRERNDNFAKRSLVTVFGLQAVLAWLISIPLLAAITSPAVFGVWHIGALILFAIGFFFEAVGDWQLAVFKQSKSNEGKVLDSGVWRYTRHPNYFGEACIWWSFFLFAAAGGHYWTIIAPIAMTFLLLKVSGVTLLEKDISERRPGYQLYIQNTSAFIPWFPKASGYES